MLLQVAVCQQTGQAMRAASRCLWDPTNDGSAWDHFQNDTLTCICQVMLQVECVESDSLVYAHMNCKR